jgi:hypothetical protein
MMEPANDDGVKGTASAIKYDTRAKASPSPSVAVTRQEGAAAAHAAPVAATAGKTSAQLAAVGASASPGAASVSVEKSSAAAAEPEQRVSIGETRLKNFSLTLALGGGFASTEVKCTSTGTAKPLIGDSTSPASFTAFGNISQNNEQASSNAKIVRLLKDLLEIDKEMASIGGISLEEFSDEAPPVAAWQTGNRGNILFGVNWNSTGDDGSPAIAKPVATVAPNGSVLAANGGPAGFVVAIRNSIAELARFIRAIGGEVLIEAPNKIHRIGDTEDIGVTADTTVHLTKDLKASINGKEIVLIPATSSWGNPAQDEGLAPVHFDGHAYARHVRVGNIVTNILKALRALRTHYVSSIDEEMVSAGIDPIAYKLSGTDEAKNITTNPVFKPVVDYASLVTGLYNVLDEWLGCRMDGKTNPLTSGNLPAILKRLGLDQATPYQEIAAGRSYPSGTAATTANDRVDCCRNTVMELAQGLGKLGIHITVDGKLLTDKTQFGITSTAGANSKLFSLSLIEVVIPGGDKVTLFRKDQLLGDSTGFHAAGIADNVFIPSSNFMINNFLMHVCNGLYEVIGAVEDHIMDPSFVAGVSGQVTKLEEEAKAETQNVIAELKAATSTNIGHKSFAYGYAGLGGQYAANRGLFIGIEAGSTFIPRETLIHDKTINGGASSTIHAIDGGAIRYDTAVDTALAAKMSLKTKCSFYGALMPGISLYDGRCSVYAAFVGHCTKYDFLFTPNSTGSSNGASFISTPDNGDGTVASDSLKVGVYKVADPEEGAEAIAQVKKEWKGGASFGLGIKFMLSQTVGIDLRVLKALNRTIKVQTDPYETRVQHDTLSGGGTHELEIREATVSLGVVCQLGKR